MATLHVTEYTYSGTIAPANIGQVGLPLPQEPATADQVVTFTTSVASAAFNAATKYVRLLANADCHIQIAAVPVATVLMQKLTAGQEYWRAVLPGHKVAAILAA